MLHLPYPVVFTKFPPGPGLWPKVSVIVPARNAEATIGDCLDSLAKQVYPHYEILVVDDCSTDKTAQIAVEKGLDVIKLDEHRGPGAARNLGAKKSSGQILVFCEADGVYPADHLVRLVTLLSQTGIHAAHLGGRQVLTHTPTAVSKVFDRWLNKIDYLILKSKRGAGAFAFHRSVFEELGGYDETLAYGEDIQLVSRLTYSGMRFAFAVGSGWWHKDPSNFRDLLCDAIRRGEASQKIRIQIGARVWSYLIIWLGLILSPLGIILGLLNWRFLLWPLIAAGFLSWEDRPFSLAILQGFRDEGVIGIIHSSIFAYPRRLGFGIGSIKAQLARQN